MEFKTYSTKFIFTSRFTKIEEWRNRENKCSRERSALLEKAKIRMKLSLCLMKHYAVMEYGGVDVKIHVFFTSALVGGEW
jgi:hypothetical protein